MSDLILTFKDRYHDWLIALGQHLQLSLLAIVLSILIAIPLAILINRYHKITEIILQATGVLQTIPSLALIGLLIPFLGIGTLPALIALVLYALFPILQNTLTGLNGIDKNLVEAATAFGMTKWEKLKTFELPLALPVIISGIRTSTVMIIGTATLAALIGAGGLGSFILLGIDRNNASLILIGAISSALLAILLNLLIKQFEKIRLKAIVVGFLVLTLGTLGSYTPNFLVKKENQTIVVAGKLGAEPDILINMYKLLIEKNTAIKVTLKPNFGKTNFLYEALKSGNIDIYPEFTGTITSSLLKEPPISSTDEKTVYEQARKGILKQDKLILLKPMLYENTYAIAVPQILAKQYQLSTISDLAKHTNQLKAGFTLEFNDREDGNKGLQSIYGLHLPVSTMEPALRYQAIANGDVQVTDAYSTDPELIKYHLTILKDDKHLFPPYQGAPLMSEHLLEKYPKIKPVLNQLAGKITSKEMSQMNYQVSVEKKSAYQVAKTYLEKHDLY